MSAYESFLVDDVARNVGTMLQTATLVYDYEPDVFLFLFQSSKAAHGIEIASPRYLTGMSGTELFWDVIWEKECRRPTSCPVGPIGYSPVFWVGWALARYQWHSERTFERILSVAGYDDFLALYPTLHEAPEEKTCITLDNWFAHATPSLKTHRIRTGLTQQELSDRSGVSINTIRAYERRAKETRRASYDTLKRLSDALNLDVEDIVD